MNERQKFAISNPIENAFGMDPEPYSRRESVSGLNINTILTVDPIGDGTYQWHVSLSVLSKSGQPMEVFGNISTRQGQAMIEHMQKLIEGVGTGKTSMIPPYPIYHMFRDLSAEELSRLCKFSASVRN